MSSSPMSVPPGMPLASGADPMRSGADDWMPDWLTPALNASDPPSIVDLAALSSGVYDFEECVEGLVARNLSCQPRLWRLSREHANWTTGLAAATYRSEDGQSVLVFRGTDSGWRGFVDWVLSNAPIAMSGTPAQFDQALRLTQEFVAGGGDYVTGHSLGGALAMLVAAHTGVAGVSFNAPGVLDSCLLWADLSRNHAFETLARCRANPRVRNIRTSGDLVSKQIFLALLGPLNNIQAGAPVESLETHGQCAWYDMLCAHEMSTVLGSLTGVAAWLEPIRQ